MSISTSAVPPRMTYIVSPGSPWWQTSWPAAKFTRSLVKASSFSFAGSILRKDRHTLEKLDFLVEVHRVLLNFRYADAMSSA